MLTFINCILIVSLCDCHTYSLKATLLDLTWLFCDLCRAAEEWHGLVHLQGSEWDGRDIVECRPRRWGAHQPRHYLPPHSGAIHLPRTTIEAHRQRRATDERSTIVEREPEQWCIGRHRIRRRVLQSRHRRGLPFQWYFRYSKFFVIVIYLLTRFYYNFVIIITVSAPAFAGDNSFVKFRCFTFTLSLLHASDATLKCLHISVGSSLWET